MANELLKLLDEFPNEEWDYLSLSENPNVTLEYITTHPDKPWSYQFLSKNPNMTAEYIKAHPDRDIYGSHWDHYSFNKRQEIEDSISKYYCNVIDYIQRISETPANEYLDENMVGSGYNEYRDRWLYIDASRNRLLRWEFILQNSDKPWSYDILSGNPCITWEIVKTYHNINWSYPHLSSNANITFEIIEDNPELAWSFYWVSTNPNITCEIVKKNIDKYKWNFKKLSENRFSLDADIAFIKTKRYQNGVRSIIKLLRVSI